MEKIAFKIITPERVLYEGDVDKIQLSGKGEVGEFTVLPRHIPMTSTVGNGTVKIYIDENETKEATMFGGFIVVEHNSAVLMADVAEWPEDIDVERAKAAKQRAEERLKTEDQNFERARVALLRAIQRIDLAEKYRK